MKCKILVPINKNFGATYFRMEVPASYFDSSIEVHFHRYLFDKYKALPFEVQNSSLKRLVGLTWDYTKWIEALVILLRKSNYDTLWLSRSLLNYKNQLDKLVGDIIYDLDDSVWLEEAKYSFKFFCEKSRVVFAGNQYLAEQAEKYSKHVKVVPTSIDINHYKQLPQNNYDGFVVGWIGSSSGFKFLKEIEAPLLRFFQNHKGSKLSIVADRFPVELDQLSRYVHFIKWSIATDVQEINTFDVGIMPIDDTLWGRGKCSFKMLQYMACEVPVVVSPIGMNKDVLGFSSRYGPFGKEAVVSNDWIDNLSYYYSMNRSTRELQGLNGRQVVLNHFAASKVSQQIASYIKEYS